jgi:hypothetical protein
MKGTTFPLLCVLFLISCLHQVEGKFSPSFSSSLPKPFLTKRVSPNTANVFTVKEENEHPVPSSAVISIRGGESLDWRYFVAGGVCAAFSHGVTTPLGKFYSFPCGYAL